MHRLLSEFDEGAFVIDYVMPAGTSLNETDRTCRQVEDLLAKTPEIASWSRLSGARSGSGLELSEQNQGDILVRLQTQRKRDASEIMDDVRKQLEETHPNIQVDLIQILQGRHRRHSGIAFPHRGKDLRSRHHDAQRSGA